MSSLRYQVGDSIAGRFAVHQALEGGMGEVYLCTDLDVGQPFALKTFQARFLNNARLQLLFEREANAWIALGRHPNIVHCIYFAVFDNLPFVVLEWVSNKEERPSLRQWLQYGIATEKAAVSLLIDVCQGLSHAARVHLGVVHRDLKPENILIGRDGTAKITDFGLVRIAQDGHLEIDSVTRRAGALVSSEGVVGTPPYMAPEQWENGSVDSRTDIYAIGCMLFELLTGSTPFTIRELPNTTQEHGVWLKRWRQCHLELSPPRLPSRFRSELADIIERCLAKSPIDRFGTPEELMKVLSELHESAFGEAPVSKVPPRDRPIDYHFRGVSYASNKQHQAAIEEYSKAIAEDSSFADAYAARGVSHARLGNLEQAIADFTTGLRLGTDRQAEAYANRGAAFLNLKRHDEALQDLEKAAALSPDSAPIHYNIGSIWAARGDWAAALPHYERAAHLGLPQAREQVAYVKNKIGGLEFDVYAILLLERLFSSESLHALRTVTDQYPMMLDEEFISHVEGLTDGIADPVDRTAFKTRVQWLREIESLR